MPINAAEKKKLFEALERAHWTWRDEVLSAPHGTMWLDNEDVWDGDLRSFRDHMIGRADRIRQNLHGSSEHADDVQRSLGDVAGLLEVLDMLLE